MSAFDDAVDAALGDDNAMSDIRICVRRLWFYDIPGIPIRVWDGKGKLFTADDNEWLGTITPSNENVHKTPSLSDGRDGTSKEYEFSFGYLDEETYEGIKADQSIVFGAPLVCYLALINLNEGLRPATPISFFQEFTLMSPLFEEQLVREDTRLIRRFVVSAIAKDGNFGRSSTPRRTYTDTMQKEYALQLGVENDRGCEFVAGLANRTYRAPN